MLKIYQSPGPACINQAGFAFQKRHLFRMLNAILSQVDSDRIKEVGPDKACSEWLLRVGAKVRFVGQPNFIDDCNALPPTKDERLKIEEIDFTNTVAMNHGFGHFRRLKHVKKIKIDDGEYMNNTCLSALVLIKNSLEHLEIRNSSNITPVGIESLLELENLRRLILEDLPEVEKLPPEEKKTMLKYLKQALPNCTINFFEERKKIT